MVLVTGADKALFKIDSPHKQKVWGVAVAPSS